MLPGRTSRRNHSLPSVGFLSFLLILSGRLAGGAVAPARMRGMRYMPQSASLSAGRMNRRGLSFRASCSGTAKVSGQKLEFSLERKESSQKDRSPQLHWAPPTFRLQRRGLSASATDTAFSQVESESKPLTPLRSGTESSPPRVVIVGGGFGGLYTALKLMDLKWDIKPEVTLIDVSDRFLFKPLMYELITGEATLDQVAPLFSEVIGMTGVRFVQSEVSEVTPSDVPGQKAGRVTLSDGQTLDYDFLVMGVGAETDLNLAEGAKEYAMGFGTLQDVRELEQALMDIEDSTTRDSDRVDISVVGGGPGGVELAATVADRLEKSLGNDRFKIALYVSGGELMESFAKDARKVALDTLAAKGIEVKYSNRVAKVERNLDPESKPFVLKTIVPGSAEDSTDQNTDLVLWTAGAKPKEVKGMPGANGPIPVTIEKTLKIQGFDREFALGDVAGMGLPATAQVAIQQADYCAWNIFASVNGEKELPFRYQNLGNLLALGPLEGTATVTFPGVGDVTIKGPVASALRKLVYVYRMPTNQQRLKVGSEWLRAPDLWVPPEAPKELKDLEKLNPFVNAPNLEKLLDEEGQEELKEQLKDAFAGLYDRIRQETARRP